MLVKNIVFIPSFQEVNEPKGTTSEEVLVGIQDHPIYRRNAKHLELAHEQSVCRLLSVAEFENVAVPREHQQAQ